MSYTVVYQREAQGDERGRRWWLARVPTVKGCHTQGRTLGEARRRIREALGLFVEDADHAKLIDDVRLPARITLNLRRLAVLNETATRAEREASRAARRAVHRLQDDLHLSTRDTAEMLGLSHQRVSQLARSGK